MQPTKSQSLKSLFTMPKALRLPGFAAALVVSSVALAATFTIQDVNLKVLELIKPFNNPVTKMEFAFTSLNVDATRALDFGFTGFVSKLGSQNEAKLEVKKAQYSYGTGAKPTASVDLNVEFDIVKALGQDVINKVAGELDDALVEMSADFVKDYGSAITVTAKTEELKLDAAGNVEVVKLRLSAVMDFAKLPATKTLDAVEFQTLDVVVRADTKGLTLQGEVVLNPLYRGFQSDQNGMKEYVEKLLVDDEQTYAELKSYLGFFDAAADWIVELKP